MVPFCLSVWSSIRLSKGSLVQFISCSLIPLIAVPQLGLIRGSRYSRDSNPSPELVRTGINQIQLSNNAIIAVHALGRHENQEWEDCLIRRI